MSHLIFLITLDLTGPAGLYRWVTFAVPRSSEDPHSLGEILAWLTLGVLIWFGMNFLGKIDLLGICDRRMVKLRLHHNLFVLGNR